jgi:PAS domain S-box-containing protein
VKNGIFPVIILAVITLLLIIFNPFTQYSFDHPYLQFTLNLLFITGTGITIATISAKSYLKEGSPNILLLGCAVLVSGFTGFFTGWASTSANANMTVFSLGIFISSCLQLAAAHVTISGANINWFKKRKITLAIFYSSSIISMVALSMISVLGVLPPFFKATGPAVLGKVFLGIAFVFFVFSWLIFVYQYLKTKSSVLYWYALGLLIISGSIFGTFFAEQFTGALLWVSRCAQYIGGFYFLIALLSLRNFESQNLTFAGKWQEAFIPNKKQAANFFSKMLDGFTYCKIITDSNGKPEDWLYLDVNDAFAKNSGHKREDFLGKKGSDMAPNLKVECARWLERFGEVALTGKAVMFEDYSKPFKKWFSISVYSPKKEYFITLSEDITERKEAENALKASEQRWITTLSSIGDAVISTDIDGNINFINAVAENVTGFKESEVLGKPLNQVFTLMDKKTNRAIENPIEKTLVNQTTFNLADNPLLISKNKRETAIEYNVSPIKSEQNQTIGFVLVFRDITQRKKLEEVITYSEMKYRRVFETSQDGIIARNLQGRMIDCNQAYAKMLGYTKKELKDHSYTQVLPQKWHEHRENVIKTVLETGRSMFYDREYIRKDGSIFPASVRTWRLTSDKGEVLGVWSTVRDISSQREYQMKLEEYSKQLEQLVEERTRKLKDAERLAAIGETAGMVGHDIRNPLQSIIAEVFLSKQELEGMPEGANKNSLKESLASIENQAMYINKIVADLQDFTKLTKPQIEEIPLQKIFKDALCTIPIPEFIKIKVSIKPSSSKIKSDPNLLKRILTNLSLNAVQAMPKGGTLTLKATLKNGTAVISVQDTGAGIPDEAKTKLFKPLFTTKPKGQGFGLAVAKKLTESLNGTITFESIKDVGTTFTISLPQKQENPKAKIDKQTAPIDERPQISDATAKTGKRQNG